jgi:hypothetical protein
MNKFKNLLQIACFLISGLIFTQTSFSQTIDFSEINKSIEDVQTEKQVFHQKMESLNADGKIKVSVLEVDKKGKSNESTYEFNLRDVSKENLRYKIDKDIIKITVQTVSKTDFIKQIDNGEFKKFTDNFEFYCRDYEVVKNIVEKLTEKVDFFNKKVPQNSPPDTFEMIQDWLIANIKTIKESKGEIEQSIAFSPENPLICTYTQKQNGSKGQEINFYTFNIFDLLTPNPNVKNSKESFSVEFGTKSKNKFISVNENGKVKNNDNEIKILAEDPSNAKLVISAFQKLSALSEKIFNSSQTDVSNFKNAVSYLKDGFSFEINEICESKIFSKKDEKIEEFRFNFFDLDEYSPVFKVDGSGYEINVKSKNKLDYVAEFENEAFSRYTNSIDLFNTNLEKVRNSDKAIKTIIKECQNKYKLDVPDGKPEELVNWLKIKIPNFKNETSAITQKIEMKDGNPCVLTFKNISAQNGKTKEFEYELKPYLIDTYLSTVKVEKLNVYVDFVTIAKEKVLNVVEDGKPGNFTNTVSFQIDDIKRAKEVYEVFRKLVTGCK